MDRWAAAIGPSLSSACLTFNDATAISRRPSLRPNSLPAVLEDNTQQLNIMHRFTASDENCGAGSYNFTHKKTKV